MTTITRRGALGVAASLLATPALAQGRFPNRPIRFLIPWPPGGRLDALHRQMFEIMNKDLGQPVLIENKPGARGTQAALFLINQAQPDGYTLAHHHLSILRHPFLTKQKTWDPIADFTYIMQVSGFLFGTAVRADSPYKTFRDLIDAARKSPGKLTYSTSGIATTNHLAMEEICAREKVEMTHIPYRGIQEGVTALLGRQIDVVGRQLLLAAERGGRRAAAALGLDAGAAGGLPRCADAARPRLRHGGDLALRDHRAEGDGPGTGRVPAPRLPQGL